MQMKDTQQNNRDKEHKYHLVGWMLFVICALFFIASSLKHGDALTLIGSLLFLVSCIVFIIPLVDTMKKSADSNGKAYGQSNSGDTDNRPDI